MVVDPADPDTVYAGTIGDGIWKTIDGGASWEQIWNATINTEALLDVNALAISPANPNIIYAAAYNYAALSMPLVLNRLIKSQDSGGTWETVYETSPLEAKVDDICISNQNAAVIYFVTDYLNVYKSTDGGTNWEDASGTSGANPLPLVTPLGPRTGRICSICVHPDFSNILEMVTPGYCGQCRASDTSKARDLSVSDFINRYRRGGLPLFVPEPPWTD